MELIKNLKFLAVGFALSCISAQAQGSQDAPKPGDILLEGSVVNLKTNSTLLLSVKSVTLPNGHTSILKPSRLKTIRLSKNTAFKSISRSSLAVGNAVSVEGKDGRAGGVLLALVIKGATQQQQSATSSDEQLLTLKHQIDDYNDLLIKAQEASHNSSTAGDAVNKNIAMMSQATSNQADQIQNDIDALHKDVEKYIKDEQDDLAGAITLKVKITNSPKFSELYHETRVCLPPEEIIVDKAENMEKAQALRFIEKRD